MPAAAATWRAAAGTCAPAPAAVSASVATNEVLPIAFMNNPRLVGEHWSDDGHPILGAREEIAARHEEAAAGEHGELRGRQRIDHRSDAGPIHLAHTHRTRLAAGVEHASRDL